MNDSRIKDFEFDWNSEEGQKIIKEVSNRIREYKSEDQLVLDERYEKLKKRLKKLLQENEHLSLINEENKNKEQ